MPAFQKLPKCRNYVIWNLCTDTTRRRRFELRFVAFLYRFYCSFQQNFDMINNLFILHVRQEGRTLIKIHRKLPVIEQMTTCKEKYVSDIKRCTNIYFRCTCTPNHTSQNNYDPACSYQNILTKTTWTGANSSNTLTFHI